MTSNLGHAGAGAVRALHRRLLPADPRTGWTPYVWLVWLIGFFLKWFVVPLEPVELTLAVLTVPVFLALYFDGFWHSGRRVFINIAGILLIGLVWTPFNPSAMGFFIYASAFIGRADRPPRAYAWLAGVVLLIVIEWLVFDPTGLVLLFGGMSAMIGAVTIHSDELDRQEAALKLSRAEVRRLAAVAERERIGRDLHDLLGHTLSVITLKAELAAKLAARGDARAEQEIREVERISRGALREIREAVAGFRRTGLDDELANARLACEAGGISLTVDRPAIDVSLEQEPVLAMCLREAITNVVRHAAAGRCRASLVCDDRWLCLTVADDGRGGAIREGAGLAGMRERVELAGGKMTIEAGSGVTVTVRIPADPRRSSSGLPPSPEAAA